MHIFAIIKVQHSLYVVQFAIFIFQFQFIFYTLPLIWKTTLCQSRLCFGIIIPISLSLVEIFPNPQKWPIARKAYSSSSSVKCTNLSILSPPLDSAKRGRGIDWGEGRERGKIEGIEWLRGGRMGQMKKGDRKTSVMRINPDPTVIDLPDLK